jgi:hypothetical protein
MVSDDKPKPKLPPPPQVGGDASDSRLAPPNIGKGKTEARKVGIDTSFIDGLTAGLIDVPEADTDPPSPVRADGGEPPAKTGRADDAKPADEQHEIGASSEIDEDQLEQLPTRALPAMDENGDVAASPEDDAPAEAGGDADGVAPAPARPVTAAGEVRTGSETAPGAPGVPRSWLMIGAAAGLMSLAVLWKVCGGGDASSTSRDGEDRIAALDRGEDVGDPEDADAARGGGAGPAANSDEDGAGGGGHDRADGAVEVEVEDEDRAADAAEDEDQAIGPDDNDTDEPMAIEPDAADDDQSGARGSGGGAHKALPPGEQSTDRAAEDQMSAEELLRAAKEAYAKGKARDAYRLANLSHQKQKSDDALEVKAKAACRMKNKDLAKSAFKSLPLGEKRREVRQTCREFDVRLGL